MASEAGIGSKFATRYQALPPWDTALPPVLVSRYAGWRRETVWATERGSVLRLTSSGGEAHYFKRVRPENAWRVQAERDRLLWAGSFLPVPEVVDQGGDGACAWLLTLALPGRSGVDPALLGEPARLVPALARGLRRLHKVAAAAVCPFDSRLETMLARVRERYVAGLIDAEYIAAEYGLGVEDAVAYVLRRRPATEDLVVCHGDYCFPNALLQDGEVTGYVDLGALGVADRWLDLAAATWSATHNLGPGYEDLFLEAYGVRRDEARLTYYRLIYDLLD